MAKNMDKTHTWINFIQVKVKIKIIKNKIIYKKPLKKLTKYSIIIMKMF